MKFMQSIKNHAAIQLQLAVTLINSVIDQYARGFAESESTQQAMRVYVAIAERFPADVITPTAMLKTMKKRAVPTEAAEQVDQVLVNLFGEQQTKELADEAYELRIDEIEAIEAEFLEDISSTTGCLADWDKLPAIAQWNYIVRTEEGLQRAVLRYAGWFKRSPSVSNKERFDSYVAGAQAMPDVVTRLGDHLSADLSAARAEGHAVRERATA